MELKELKKEIDSLQDLNKTLRQFKNSWIRQIKANTNPEFAFLYDLDDHTKKKVNLYLQNYQQVFNQLKYAQLNNEKLSTLAQYLIELKLTTLNGDQRKPKLLLRKFIKDDFLNLKTLVDEVNQFEFNLNNLKSIYHETNQLITNSLPLEHSLIFLDAPHKEHLNVLSITAQRQKELLKTLGQEFIQLTKTGKRKWSSP